MKRLAAPLSGLVLVGGTAWLASYDGVILDQKWAREFFVVKGLVAVAAVVLTCVHMMTAWHQVPTWGQRLRYLFLLVTVVTIAAASSAQFEAAPVYGRNVGGLEIALLACVAMVVSIRQERRDR